MCPVSNGQQGGEAMSMVSATQATNGIGHARPLAGQTALVTGAASGIGAGAARALAMAGAAVVVNYVGGAESAEAVVADIAAAGGTAMAQRADVSREDEVAAMFRATVEAHGGLDILVSNAGIQKDAPITDMTLAQWNAVIGVNLTGTFLCAREAARVMIRQDVRLHHSRAAGKIICISSVHEQIPWAGHVNYAASKGGMKLFMQSLAQELAPHRIRVNSVAPGAIQTPINRPAWETPQALTALLTLIPYGRIGQPADIGNVVAWLASDAADYVHGQTIFVDGGMTLYPEFARGG
jgi:glucose 1-dehydrogenase